MANFDREKLLREVRIVVCTVLVGVCAARVATLPDLSITTDKLNNVTDKVGVVIDKAAGIEDSAKKLGHKVAMDYDDPEHPTDGLYYNLQNDFFNSQQASKHLDEFVLQTNTNINGKNGVLSNVNGLLSQVTVSVRDLSNDLNFITIGADGVLTPLKASLANVDTLTKELADEVAKGGNIDQTIVKLNKNLDDTDKLLADPNIAATIANGQSATASFASTAKTLDIVTLPYRKKIGQVKLLLGKILDAFKITMKLW